MPALAESWALGRTLGVTLEIRTTLCRLESDWEDGVPRCRAEAESEIRVRKQTQNSFFFSENSLEATIQGGGPTQPKTKKIVAGLLYSSLFFPRTASNCVFQIDMFSFGVLLAQLLTSEYPRLDTRREQVFLRTSSRVSERMPPENLPCRSMHSSSSATFTIVEITGCTSKSSFPLQL